MSVETKKIYHISAPSATLIKTQMGVEDTNDADLGWRMWCGRDDEGATGNITKWLAKDRPARVTSMVVDDTSITASLVNVEPSGDIRLTAGNQLELGDRYTVASSTWTWDYIPLSQSEAELFACHALLGNTEGSILALILAAAASSGTAPLTAGYVGYGSAGGLLTGENVFVYDAANNYLGVGSPTPECGVDVGGANPTYVTGGTAIHASGNIEGTNIYARNNLYLPNYTAGSIPYLSGSPVQAVEDNTYLSYTGAAGVVRAFSSTVSNPTTMDIGATSTYSGETATVTISATAASAVALVDIASTQNVDIHPLYNLKLRTTGADGDIEVTATGDVIISGDLINVSGTKTTNLQNESWGSASAAGWSSGTVTANFSTGKDIQKVAVNANVTTLTLTAPTGGDAKTMRIVLENETATHTFGGVGWATVHWPVSANPVGTPVSADQNDFVIIDLAYIDGDWFGEVDVWEYSGE